jgi:hypothetical protein
MLSGPQEDFEFQQAMHVLEEAVRLGSSSGASRKQLAQLLTNMAAIKRQLGSVEDADGLLRQANALLRPVARETVAGTPIEEPRPLAVEPASADPSAVSPGVPPSEGALHTSAPQTAYVEPTLALDPAETDEFIANLLV